VFPEFGVLKEQLSNVVELHDIPSRTLFIRKPAFPATTVRATMSLNGDSIVVETSRYKSKDDIAGTEEKCVIPIDVENGRTFYVHKGRRIEPAEVASIILQPIRDVATKRCGISQVYGDRIVCPVSPEDVRE
jgi:hypothetical protein